ncbi:MAG: metallophosphoesterase [Thermoguttaceae bacterium]|nr:metallophosphoesterase [Thermoguttaceae bacterium]
MFKRSSRESVTKRVRSKKRIVAEWFFGLCSFTYFLFYWENNAIETSRFEISDPRIPRSLDGLKIVQISDLHAKKFGKDNRRLFARIRGERPDLLAITGDLIDERGCDLKFAREFASRCSEIAPTFYVTGNHEGAFVDPIREGLLGALEEGGAVLMDDRWVEARRDETGSLEFLPVEDGAERTPTPDSVLIAGLIDPQTTYTIWRGLRDQYRLNPVIVEERLAKIPIAPEEFTVLLSHRPEHLALYAKYRVDLVLTGHAHGGQFRLPWLLPNGLFAPNQGYFPRYTNGRCEMDGTVEIVSRGLGPSVLPTRFYNRPNLVVCVLRSASGEESRAR